MVRAAVDAWGSLTHHPGLLVPLEGFVATELDGSPSLVVTTSYVPGAVTLAQAHLQPTQVRRAAETFCVRYMGGGSVRSVWSHLSTCWAQAHCHPVSYQGMQPARRGCTCLRAQSSCTAG